MRGGHGTRGTVGRAVREADLTFEVSPPLGHQEEGALVARTLHPGGRGALFMAQHVALQLAPSANFST